MEPAEDQKTNSKPPGKKQRPIERVTIEDNLRDKLNNLVSLANAALQGVTEVSRADIVNLILQLHSNELSNSETEELRKTHFDVFKCLAWLQHQAKEAKGNGNQLSLKELLEKNGELMKNNFGAADKKVRKLGAKKIKDVVPPTPNPAASIDPL